MAKNVTEFITTCDRYFIIKYYKRFITKCEDFVTECDNSYKIQHFL